MRGQPGGLSHFRDLFRSALQDYERATNITLDKYPFAEQIHNCQSVESITTFLQDQARALGDFRGNDRLMKSNKNTVSILCILSATAALGDAAHLVCLKRPMQVFHGFVKITRFLIEHGSDTTARGDDGRTPLHDATSFGYIEVARILVEHGADATAQANDRRSPLHVAAFYGNLEIARILIEHGADVTARTNDGWIPLHSASLCGGVQIVRFLVEHGADMTARDNYDSTPWDVASKKGHVEVARFLEEFGAYATAQADDRKTPSPASAEERNDHGADRRRWTPSHFEVAQGNLDVVRFLVDHGADARALADDGWSPLDVASSRGHVEIVHFLVGQGVDPTARDHDGRSPLHEALSYGHMEVARFLFEHSTIANTATIPPTQGSRFIYYLVALVLLVGIYLHFM